jgi:hypothetical protein
LGWLVGGSSVHQCSQPIDNPLKQWLLGGEGEAGEEESSSRLVAAALRHGPIGGGSGGGSGSGEEEAAAASSSVSLGAGGKEERPSVRALAQRLRGCLEVSVKRREEARASWGSIYVVCLLSLTHPHMHAHPNRNPPRSLPTSRASSPRATSTRWRRTLPCSQRR